MRSLVFLFVIIFQSHLFAANKENGAVLYKKCQACHGKEGLGKKSQKAPMLAGQFDWYVKAQILAIKSGTRANNNTKKMMPFVKNLSDSEIEDLAAYISSMPRLK